MFFIILSLISDYSCNAAAAAYDASGYKIQDRDYNSGDYIISAINVKDYGAVGDGKADDTNAFEDAIDEARQNKGRGGIVYIPSGKYRITRTLFIYKNVTLRGQWKNPDKNISDENTVIYADIAGGLETGTAFIQLAQSSALKGLTIYYPNQKTSNITPYAYTIQATGHTVSIDQITLINSYKGIDVGLANGGSAHYIGNIYGTVLKEGIHLDYNYEVSEIVNVNFSSKYWTNYDNENSPAIKNYTKANCIAIRLGKVDDVFIYNANIPNAEFKTGVSINYNKDIPNPPKIAYGLLIKLNGATIAKENNPDPGMPELYEVDLVPGSSSYSHQFAADRYSSKANLYNVRSPKYSAVGDGTSDDTQPIMKALNDAKSNGGGTVYLPAGKYKITQQLTIPVNTELRGEWDSIHPKSPTEIYLYGYRGKAEEAYITLSQYSGIHGLTFRIPELMPEQIVSYPWIVKGNGSNAWVEYVTLINAFNGINFYDNKCDNFLIKGVWGTAMNKGIAIGGGSSNGRLEFNMFTYGTWWEEISRRVKLDDYTYENATGYLFGACSNISAISTSEFGLKYGVVFDQQNGGIPQNIALFRCLLDNPLGRACVNLKSGNNISFIGLSDGISTANNGKLIYAENSFNGKVRIFGQNFWGGAVNVLSGKDIIIYNKNSTNPEIINHNFSFDDNTSYTASSKPYSNVSSNKNSLKSSSTSPSSKDSESQISTIINSTILSSDYISESLSDNFSKENNTGNSEILTAIFILEIIFGGAVICIVILFILKKKGIIKLKSNK